MSVTVQGYDQVGNMALQGVFTDVANLKLMLVQDMYSFDSAHSLVSDVNGDELYADGGYATGGKALDGASAMVSGRSFTSPSVNWTAFDTAFTGVIGHAILYHDGSFGGVASPVLSCWTFSPAIGINNVPWAFSWLNSTVYKISEAV